MADNTWAWGSCNTKTIQKVIFMDELVTEDGNKIIINDHSEDNEKKMPKTLYYIADNEQIKAILSYRKLESSRVPFIELLEEKAFYTD